MHCIYGICFYFGYFKLENIKKHIDIFTKLQEIYPEWSFEFCISCMIDEKDAEKRQEICKERLAMIPIPFTALHAYNSCGTILGLEMVYDHYKDTDAHVIFFEEDFHATNLAFFKDSLTLLTDTTTYVGETTTGKLKEVRGRQGKAKDFLQKFGSDVEIWTDGGYYCSTIQKLRPVKEKLGVFHTGDRETKYNHGLDGIALGEVGFPTHLHFAGFQFTCLYRGTYFKHDG